MRVGVDEMVLNVDRPTHVGSRPVLVLTAGLWACVWLVFTVRCYFQVDDFWPLALARLFNVFIVVPQLLVATAMGSIMKAWFPGEPIRTMAFAAGTLVIAALAMLRVEVPGEA